MRILLTIAIGIAVSYSIAQTKDSPLHPDAFNKKLMEHLIKQKVDSVRASVGLPALANDSILYIASNYHADYCLNKGGISHYQVDNDPMRTPQMRGDAFGAVNYQIGENIVKGSARLGKNKYFTYNQIASKLVVAWVNSPGHYKNMTSRDYQITGLSAVYDHQRGMVISVQKFAKVLFKYQFKENKEMFSYSNYTQPPPVSSFDGISRERITDVYDWKIRSPKKDSIEYCATCNDAIDNSIFKHRLRRKGNKIIFSTPDVNMMFEMIKRRRDGLAVELVFYEPVDCGNPAYYTDPSRRNNQSMINGRVLQPVYKKQLKRGFKKGKYKWYYKNRRKGGAKYFEMKVGTMPRDLNGYIEMNLIVLQKNKACHIMHFSDACGKKLTGDQLGLTFKHPIQPKQFTFRKRTDSLRFRIPFERGKYDYVLADIQPILDSVTSDYYIIDRAKIAAFSSIEGSEEINKNLQLRRAESIVGALRNNQAVDFPYTVTTESNWDLMNKQIESQSGLSHLKGQRKATLKTTIEDDNPKYERYLKDQRYAEIQLNVTYEIKDTIQYFKSLYRTGMRMLDTINTKREFWQMDYKGIVSEMTVFQYQIYKRCGSHDAYKLHVGKLPYPKKFQREIVRERYSMKLKWSGESLDSMEWNDFVLNESASLIEKKYNWSELYFNYMVSLMVTDDFVYQSTFMELAEEEYPNFFRKYKTEPQIKDVEIAFHLRLANAYHFNSSSRDDELMRKHCIRLKMLCMDYWNEEQLWRLGKFFSYCEQDDLAYQTVRPAAVKEKPHHPSLIHFAKLSFYHMDENRSEDYFNWLIYIRSQLTQEEWCHMFVGECNISFQVFDHENLRKFYCAECAEFPNYAQQPELWK